MNKINYAFFFLYLIKFWSEWLFVKAVAKFKLQIFREWAGNLCDWQKCGANLVYLHNESSMLKFVSWSDIFVWDSIKCLRSIIKWNEMKIEKATFSENFNKVLCNLNKIDCRVVECGLSECFVLSLYAEVICLLCRLQLNQFISQIIVKARLCLDRIISIPNFVFQGKLLFNLI